MINKIKILFTIPNFDTAGSGKAMLKLAQRLNPDVFEPHICSGRDKGDFIQTVKDSGIPFYIFQFQHSFGNKFNGLRLSWQKRKFFKQFDLVHSFNYIDDYSEALSARLAGTKWIFVKKNMGWGGNSWKVRSRLAHGIIAQNTDMMKQFYPGNKKVRLIPRGVDTTEFKPRPPAEKLLQEFGLTPKNKIVLAVANLVSVKGIEVLIDAFAANSEKLPESVLMIVGDNRGEYGDQLIANANAKGLNNRIIFTGKRKDIRDFQSIANCFVLPTLNKGRQEGSPVALLEALASGTPSLASNVSGIRDQLTDITDQLFEAGNSDELAEKLNWFLTMTEDEREAIITKQLEVLNQRYTLEHEVALHEAFYLKVIGRK